MSSVPPAEVRVPQRGGPRRGRHPLARAVLWAIALAVVLVLALGVWVAVRGWQAKNHLQAAQRQLVALRSVTTQQDLSGIDLRQVQRETAAAHRLTGDLGWSVAATAPVIGDDLAAVRATARAADELTQHALPDLLATSRLLTPDQVKLTRGRLALAPFVSAQQPLRRATASLAHAHAVLQPHSGPQGSGLVGPVQSAVTGLDDVVGELSTATATGSRVAELVPAMMGQGGKRRYLLLFQNLAEARSQGGIVGAFAVVETDHGSMRIVRQGSSSDVGPFAKPVLALGPQATALYLPRVARFFQNVTQPIDFATSARLAREMWRRTSGEQVDGVLATDPVVLSYLLAVTGPVQLQTGQQLTATNAVSLLMNRVYFEYPAPALQDAFFGGATLAVFNRLTKGQVPGEALASALSRGASEHRLLLWSARPDEQARLSPTVLSGQLPTAEPNSPTVGIFLNSAAPSKMSYYLQRTARLSEEPRRADGQRDLRVRLALTSTAPFSGLPLYVTGLAAGRRGTADVSTVIYVASPLGGGLASVEVRGKRIPVTAQVLNGRPVSAFRVDLQPGAKATVLLRLVAPPTTGAPQLRLSPSVSAS